MPTYRMSFMWNQSVMGVSETYYTPLVSVSNAPTLISQWLQLRTQMMYKNQFTVGVRLSDISKPRGSVVLVPPYDFIPGSGTKVVIPSSGVILNTAGVTDANQLRAALQTRLQYNDSYTTNRYISGVPVGMEGTEPATFQPDANPGWLSAWTNFFQNMVDQRWGLRGLSRTGANAPVQVASLYAGPAPANQLGIVVVTALAPTYTLGAKIHLQGFRPAKGTRAPTINGTWYVDSLDTTTIPAYSIVYLRNSQSAWATQQRFTAQTTISLVGYQIYPIQDYTWVRMLVHKRGRPSLAPRGRRLSRPTLDP